MISVIDRNYSDSSRTASFIVEIIPDFHLFFSEKVQQVIFKMQTICFSEIKYIKSSIKLTTSIKYS